MRMFVFYSVMLLILCIMNGLIAQKELLKASCQIIYLQLAPVDPRSLMMGDYMSLNYDLNNKARGKATGDGSLVVKLDDKKIGTFVGVYSGAPLNSDERLMLFRERSGMVQVGPPAFYFQEGHANHYSGAKYGKLLVANDGTCLLVGLCDEKLVRLGPAGSSDY